MVRNNNNELEVKSYPQNKQPVQQQLKFKPPNCPRCKRKTWSHFDESYYFKNCEYFINKQKHRTDKKILRQNQYFSTSLQYANEKIREIFFSMVNTTFNSTEGMLKKVQLLKSKTKLKFYKNVSDYYDELNVRSRSGNFQFAEDHFNKNVQSIGKIRHEVLLLLKFSQTKPSVKSMNNNSCDS